MNGEHEKLCKTCQYWERALKISGEPEAWGLCHCPKLLHANEFDELDRPVGDEAILKDASLCAAWICPMPDFGCVHWGNPHTKEAR